MVSLDRVAANKTFDETLSVFKTTVDILDDLLKDLKISEYAKNSIESMASVTKKMDVLNSSDKEKLTHRLNFKIFKQGMESIYNTKIDEDKDKQVDLLMQIAKKIKELKVKFLMQNFDPVSQAPQVEKIEKLKKLQSKILQDLFGEATDPTVDLNEFASDINESVNKSVNRTERKIEKLTEAACGKCGKKDSFTQSLKKCDACKIVLYCSRDCQKADWKEHKVECKKTQTPTSTAPSSVTASAATSSSTTAEDVD